MSLEKLTFDYSNPKILHLKLSGDWQISVGLPAVDEVTSQFALHRDVKQVTFDFSEVNKWDSGLISFLLDLVNECERRDISVVREGLPQGVQKLLTLSLKMREKVVVHQEIKESFLESIGTKTLEVIKSIRLWLDFLGEVALSFGRLFMGKSCFRRDDFVSTVQKCGADALGLVSLISVLVGTILAFIGAIQLKLFGAQIYIADIVGIAMVRVMGAVMTAVLMSGRTGASFAAELGIMQTNEEIDALKTLGVNPIDFLVLPRVLALVIMLPLLTLYADLMGIVGGFIISTGVLGLNPVEYLNHTQAAVKLSNVWVGLIHSFVFGVIIAIVGCLRGIQCQRSARAVGEATTSAVVTAITGIVIATAIITFVCQVLGV
ncbi:MAG: ABC transporter permease [Candidatus Omnitrophica bacterium]|nr:ABC transporter permease [Candidatus Omnitrophota bacterium]